VSTTTPAGWYPDPKPSDPANPGKRWWNGTDWTVSTKTDEVLTATTATASYADHAFPAVAVPKPPRKRRPALVAGAVAAVLGLAVGSLTTYLIMEGRHTSTASSLPSQGSGNGGQSGGGQSGGGQSSGGQSGGGQSGGSGGSGGGLAAGPAVDVADGISLPDPGTGWTGATTQDGHAALVYGSYTCAGSSGGTCSYAGASTSTLTASVSAGAKAAATADMAKAVSDSYGTITGHTQLESQPVTVAGRAGYLIRWKVDAKVGNNGTVEDVVFPNSAGTQLIAVHLGFDISPKAPPVSVMDSIVSGIQDYSGGSGTGGGTGGSGGSGTTTS
jgi:Protein of unknown function (DUF2510)